MDRRDVIGHYDCHRREIEAKPEQVAAADGRTVPMRIVEARPTTKASSDHFVGDAWIDRITDAEPPSRIRVNVVRFAPGARNAWHAHPEGQTLHVTEGIGRVQSRGDEVVEIRAGDTVVTSPGEWHWHGAAPEHFMTHLAIWEGPTEGADPEWGDHVTDAEYGF